jgi:two-component system sensor histidine kinase RpfC
LAVLGADDDVVNIKVLRRIMEKAGHRFHAVTSGDALLEEMNRGSYDIVISDINMPGIPLVEVVALYRMGMPEESIPVIALSADATPDTRKACVDAGVDAYLTKPTTQAVLLAAVGRLIAPSEPRYLLAGPKVTDLSSHPLFQPSPTPTVNGHTVESLLALGGPECLYELLEDFMRDALPLIDAMQASAEAGDYVQFRNDRHALRSGAANLGARVVMNLCQPGPIDRGDLADKGIPFCDRLRREIAVFRQDVIAFVQKRKVVP